jgi:two-component system OmpR family response regulator
VKVLIVEDHVKLASVMRRAMRAHGVLADVAIRGEDALWMAGATAYDVISLDVSLPGIDGFETCRRLRADGVATPIVMLTARDAIDLRVAGLDIGADDYVTKPFQLAELLARMRALVRRAPHLRPPVLRAGDLVYDLATCEVRRGVKEIDLTRTERELLGVLMRHPGEAVSRLTLLEDAWDGAEHRSNVVDVYIRYLREKVDRPFGVESIQTVRGFGYRLVDPRTS